MTVAHNTPTTGLGVDAIREILPHSWPFLFLDRVEEVDAGHAVGLKNVAVSEPYFSGHFPASSIMPGVLIVETAAQLAGVVVAAGAGARDDQEAPASTAGRGRSYLAGMRRVRFRRPVRPGDQLRLQVWTTAQTGRVQDFRFEARVDGVLASDGFLTLAT